ncbi:MAG: TRAP transporter substrate-binding protein [Desulfobacterales bacterium]|nr:MAG: TRAP transporter substrate-binding protein [Desulfobacterales bacterium]
MNKKTLHISMLCALIISLAFILPDLNPPAFSADVIRLKVAQYFPPPSFQSKVLEEFCRDLEKRTGGAVKVDYYSGGSLLKAPNMFDGVVSGIADIGYSHVFYTAGRMPVTEAAGLPLGYPSAWVGGQTLNDFYQEFKPKEFDQVKVLWMNTTPPSAIATAKKPIRKLEDLKGLTIRAPGMAGEVIKALGGNPAPTPMIEVYDAIAKGVIDGEASNFETLFAFKFAEVVKYTTSVWQINNPYPFYLVMNKKSYEKLPPDVRAIFDSLVGEYKERYILMWNSIDFVGKAFGLSKGVEFIDLPPSELQVWQAAVIPVIDDYVQRLVGKGFSDTEVKGWIQFLRERSDYWTKKQIELRIPSAVGPPEVRPEAHIIK